MILARLGAVAAILFAVVPAVAGVTTTGAFRIEYAGASIGPNGDLDTAVTSWMGANSIPAAQLAVRQGGRLIFSHAYTMGAQQNLIKTTNVFRLGQVSAVLATAAFSNLLTAGTLTGGERVYSYLGIDAPLLPSQTPDPRADNIISLELAEHTAGLPGAGAGDPLFAMRDIEVLLGKEPLSATQFARYLYGTPLLSTPGFTQLYSNAGYALLGMVVAKAVGQPYPTAVQNNVLLPLGMTNWSLSPTRPGGASRNEVPADDGNTGPSIFDIKANAPREAYNFEGGDIIWELAAAPIDYVTNAESVSELTSTYNVFGLGGRSYDFARDGCLPGVANWAESQTPDIDFALLLNAGPCLGFSSTVISQIRSILANM